MSSSSLPATDPWPRLEALSEAFTCYSAAIATWAAFGHEEWRTLVNPGLRLTVDESGDGLFAFAYLREDLRSTLGLVRTGTDEAEEALAGVLAEVAREGRAIVAGDAFHQPWHVACGRRHLPHWFVVADGEAGLRVVDPFAARDELGAQVAHCTAVSPEQLRGALSGLPGDDPVFALREALAFGDAAGPPPPCRFAWFTRGETGPARPPAGARGPEAVRRLARHFRERGQEPAAYVQAIDLWAIGRHRANLVNYAEEVAARSGDAEAAAWAQDHGAPLAKRWGHVAPLIMQATLALAAGRGASASLPDTLDDLAAREQAAADALPAALA